MKASRGKWLLVATTAVVLIQLFLPILLMELQRQTGSIPVALRQPEEFQSIVRFDSNLPTSSESIDGYIQAEAVLANRTLWYKYPGALSTRTDEISFPPVIVGVLSSARNADRRNIIRNTWGKGQAHVYFLVSGTWTGVEVEAVHNQDILWVDAEEHYKKITYKTLMLLHAVHTHVVSYSYILKTDDDSYVNMAEVTRILLDTRPNYWGFCHYGAQPIRDPEDKWYMSKKEFADDYMPPYGTGAGYAVSYKFNKCAAQNIKSLRFVPAEDVVTGILGARCAMNCTHDKRIHKDPRQSFVIRQSVKSDSHLVKLHKIQALEFNELHSNLTADISTNTNGPETQTADAKLKTGPNVERPRAADFKVTPLKDNVVIANQTFSYRYPNFLTTASSSFHSPVITGVLSAPGHVDRRNLIRDTWGKGYNVLFIVAGNWTYVEDEFVHRGDLLWLDTTEAKAGFTYRTQMFLHAVHTHVKLYSHVIKTGDSSYVNLAEIDRILSETNPDYWGHCFEKSEPVRDPDEQWYLSKEVYSREYFPPYCEGTGYALSRDFNECASKNMWNMTYMPFDDVATGMLAEICGFKYTHSNLIIIKPFEDIAYAIQHYVESEREKMKFLHKLGSSVLPTENEV